MSVAADAFAAALEELSRWQARPPDRRPVFDLAGPRVVDDGDGPLAAVRPSPIPEGGRIAAAAHGLRSGERTCAALVEDAIAAIDRNGERLGAFAQVLAEEALAAAVQLDDELARGEDRGALHGVPVAIKDVIDVAGAETRAGSDAYRACPADDAWSVSRLRERGAVFVGKATTHEFALGVTTPQARNPYDDSRIPGGSSGGSGIAVATGMSLAALGTDTRASTRVPASLCGVVGFKPTFGAIPTHGVVPLSWTMDHVGILAPTVEDAAVVFDALVDRPRPVGEASARGAHGLRIGVPEAGFEDADGEVAASVCEALEALADCGAEVEPSDEPDGDDFARANAMGLIVGRCEAAAFHRSAAIDRARLWAETRDQLDAADHVLATDYLDAQRFRADLLARMVALFEQRDLLAMPTTLVTAPLAKDAEKYITVLSRNAIPWSFLGFPVLSVPCRPAPSGLPLGLQLVARPGGEETLIAAGAAVTRGLATTAA